jgi:ATP-dependent exoDNAse (exonuclease V) beta subunit
MSRALGDDDEIDEERRLFYVALTRARDHLFVTYPLAVYDSRRGSEYTLDQVSRFLDRGVRHTMQRVVVNTNAEVAETPRGPQAVSLDLRAAMRARFGG